MEKLREYESQARALAAHWIDTIPMNVRDLIAIAEAFRVLEQEKCGGALLEREEHHVEVVGGLLKHIAALEQRAKAAEIEKAGAEERCRMMFDAKNHWADRARAAEAKLRYIATDRLGEVD